MALRSLYRIIVVSILTTLGIELVLGIFIGLSDHDSVSAAIDRWPGFAWPLLGAVVLFLLLGMVVLWVGMIWDCATVGNMRPRSKFWWLVLLVLTHAVGALIYYFRVFNCRRLHESQLESPTSDLIFRA